VRRLLLPLSCLVIAQAASAQCEIPKNLATANLPADKLAIRGAIYQKLCLQLGGSLIDAQDLDVRDRLIFPPQKARSDVTTGEYVARRIGQLKKPVGLVYILEPTGKVSWVAVLESSGDERIDAALVAIARAMEYQQPVTLDGRPIRLFGNIRFGPERK
jgi:TonB family protein